MTEPKGGRFTAGRWRVLASVCATMWGVYFIYDMPASLSVALSKHLSLFEPQYSYLVSTLYTVYAAPNTVLPFFSGPAVQRVGERAVLLMTMASVLLGQLVFALAVHTRCTLGLVMGRLLIGLGGEVLGVLGSEILTRRFKHNELSLALALNLGVSRLGSVANSLSIPSLIEVYSIVPATWIGSFISLAATVLGTASLLADTVGGTPTTRGAEAASAVSWRQFPRVYWQLGLVCVVGYGGINTFTNSAQRFLASCFFHGDQKAAGAAVSVPYILSGILVPPLGWLLDQPGVNNCPRALVATNILLATAHVLFLSGSTPIIPLCLLGVAFALFGVALWAGVARCLVCIQSEQSRRQADSRSQGGSALAASERTGFMPRREITNATDRCNGEGDPLVDPQRRADCDDDGVFTLGFGIMTSLNNLSTAVVPVILAKLEELAGFTGLEAVFIALSVLGWIGSVRLAWAWDF